MNITCKLGAWVGVVAITALFSNLHAVQPVEITAARVSSTQYAYSLKSNWPASATDRPVTFTLPLDLDVQISENTIQAPQGYGAYVDELVGVSIGLGASPTPIEYIVFCIHNQGIVANTPASGQSVDGFGFATGQSSVLVNTMVPFGIGNMSTGAMVFEGEVLAPMPVVGSVQVSGNLNLSNYLGRPGGARSSVLIYTRNGDLEPSDLALTAVDENGVLWAQGPELAGPYTIRIQTDGFLDKVVAANQLNNSMVINATLTNGDADGDNEVGPGDFEQIVASFGTAFGDPGWRTLDDLDGDGEVGPGDFEIAVNNFGIAGD